jgi:hypothetical protein
VSLRYCRLDEGLTMETDRTAGTKSSILGHQWGMALRACVAFAMLMEVREMTSVWKKLATLLLKGCA